jgi:putative ABC transport system permease protein
MKPHLRLIALLGLIVPRHARADWRQEWETELAHRERQLAGWDRLDWRGKLDLFRRSTSAFWDALWLYRKRLETGMIQDLRYAVRMLIRHKGFTAAAVVTLALGIGANTAIFSLLDKIVVRALPVEQPDRLVTFLGGAEGFPLAMSYPMYTAIRDRVPLIPALAAYSPRPFSLADGAAADRVTGAVVSGNYFSMLGVRPAIGRFFAPDEDRTPGTYAVAVLGYGLWRRRFGSDPAVVGRSVTLNAHAFTVIGVAPPEFTGTTRGTTVDVYVPTMMAPTVLPGWSRVLDSPNWGWLHLIGRLAPGATRAQAQAAFMQVAAELDPGAKAPAKPDPMMLADQRPQVQVLDGSGGYREEVENLTRPLQLLMAAVGFVLLIACANVANLLLARAVTRRQEIAIRLAAGASRWRIVRQLLTEGVLLAGVGGAAGLFVAARLTALLTGVQQQVTYLPHTIDGTIDARALAFTLVIAIVTGIAFGLAPARQSLSSDLVSGLKSGVPGRGARGLTLRGVLIVAQVALSVIVLVGAGLCLKGVRALQAIDTGLQPSRVVTASFDLGLAGYDEQRGRRFVDAVTRRMEALPGVESVAWGEIVPFSDFFDIGSASVEGYRPEPGERMAFDFNTVSPGYFRTIGLPLASGREFTSADTATSPPVVMINEAAARRYWRGRVPVGGHINRGRSAEVIGVVRDSRVKKVSDETKPTIYLPLAQNRGANMTLHVRTAGDPRSVLSRVRQELQAIDPRLPVFNLQTLEAQKNGSLYAERLSAMLLTLFGALATALVAVGLYGMLSYAVAERTREIGIRLALGATRGDLLSMVIRRGLVLTLVGSVAGVAGALATVRLLQGLLFGVSPTDPQVFVLVPLGLAAVALLACWIPARRATRLNPLAALRHE